MSDQDKTREQLIEELQAARTQLEANAGTGGDEASRRSAEASHRALLLLSACSQAVLHAQREGVLLDEICRLAVQVGGYRFAWLGIAENDAARTVRPVAQMGYDDDYLQTLDITWADTERGKGPTGSAVRSGKPNVAQHLCDDPKFAPWRENALLRGYASSIALPLPGRNGVWGALNIYSAEPEAFDADEVALLTDLANTIAYGVSSIRTRDEHDRAVDALRSSEERFGQIYEHLDEVCWLGELSKSKDYRILYLNGAFERVWQRPVQDVYDDASVWHKCIHPADRDDALFAHNAFLYDEGEYNLQYRVVRADGSLRTVRAKAHRIRDQASGNLRVVGVARDVTEKLRLADSHRQLEAQYLQAQKMEAIGRLAGGVAHDFNNLLTVIISYSELAVDGLPAADPLRRDMQLVLEAGERAARLTGQLLAFSRKQVLTPKVLVLNDIVGDMEHMLGRLVGEDVELRISLAEDVSTIKADPGQIEQVVMNLVVNARDAMPSGGVLTIETANAASDAPFVPGGSDTSTVGYVILRVRDEGVGMDADTQRQIFEPFFTTKEEGEGTGLGLATIYGIVKQSGGLVSVQSKVGVGSTFNVYLPMAGESPRAVMAPTPVSAARGHETILLVEDEDAVRTLVTMVLSSAGYKVLSCANAGAALLHCEQYEGDIDLMLTDVIMPQMNGDELAKRLARERPDMRVLFMSGHTGGGILGRELGADDRFFIAKPLTPAALLEKVRGVLQT